jgi:Xaa-Pro aminopeptidase
VCERLAKSSLDALLVTHLPNIAYLTGLRATAGVTLVSREAIQLVIDSRYLTVATNLVASEEAPEGLSVVPVEASYDETVQRSLADLGRARVGVEADHMSVRQWQWLVAHMRESDVTLVPTEGLVEASRLVKDVHEIECFRRAGQLIADAVSSIIEMVGPGRPERDIAAEIDHVLSKCGFEDRAFPTIVASGPNSALPHAHPSDRRVGEGDLVLLDFGAVHDGYCVDLSRTVCVPPVSDEAIRLHAAVLEAHDAAIAAVRPGVLAADVDTAARSTLARHGLAEAFGHGTGHGLGLEVHEAPRIGRPGQSGSDVVLEGGMVFTVEPGVYLPGLAGVRIEDDVLVTAAGCEVLTNASRALTIP